MKAVFFSSGGLHVATMLGMAEAYGLEDTDVVGGISAGAILASFLGSYKHESDGLSALKKILLHNKLSPQYKFLNVFLSLLFKPSFYTTDKISKILKAHLSEQHRRVMVGTTEEKSMTYNLLEYGRKANSSSSMPLWQACLSSMSAPGVFPGVDVGSKHFVDGGLFHSLPIEAICKVLDECAEKKEKLELVVFNTNPSGWSPPLHKTSLMIPRTLLHTLESIPYVNVQNDHRQLLHAVKEARRSVDVTFHYFSLPPLLVQELYEKYPPRNWGQCDSSTLKHLFSVGHDLVSTIKGHTSRV